MRHVLHSIPALLLLMNCTTVHSPNTQTSFSENLERIVTASVEHAEKKKEPISGLSLAVYSKGKPVFVKGFGFADLEKRIPISTKTVFRVGSITKEFTAAAIMLLVEEKKLKLSESVRKILPEYPGIPSEVTIEHLLSHTSGIFNYTDLPNWAELENKSMPRAELISHFLSQPADFKPGESWNYSNSGYYLLGLVIESVSGVSYRDFVDQRLVKKSGMQSTGYCKEDIDQPLQAKGYEGLVDGKWREAKPINMEHPFAAGGMCSTAEDLALWATALMRGEIVSRESLQWMETPVHRKNQPPSDKMQVGRAGMMIYDEMGHRYVGGGGSIEGFISTLDTYPNDELVVVSLGNTMSYTQIFIAISAARSVFGLIKDEVITDAQGKSLAGNYVNAESGLTLSIIWDQGQLFATVQPKGQSVEPAMRLLSRGDGSYITIEDSALIHFQEKDGKVIEASSLILGYEYKFAKINP
jgi:CubicO group peptidase (beta-lactamase class C family)